MGCPKTRLTTGRAIYQQLRAWKSDTFQVSIANIDAFKGTIGIGSSSVNKYPQGMTIEDIISSITKYSYFNTNGANIIIRPLYLNQPFVNIFIDDLKDDFKLKFQEIKPNLEIRTSPKSVQVHFVLDKIYANDFYNYLAKNLNFQFGDPKIISCIHNSRLAGFCNNKETIDRYSIHKL